MFHTEHIPLLRQLLNCVGAVVLAAGAVTTFSNTLSKHLFLTIMRISSNDKAASQLNTELDDILTKLAQVLGLADESCLYSAHIRTVVDAVKVSCTSMVH